MTLLLPQRRQSTIRALDVLLAKGRLRVFQAMMKMLVPLWSSKVQWLPRSRLRFQRIGKRLGARVWKRPFPCAGIFPNGELSSCA